MGQVSREIFADEASWLQFQANQAEMRRREALRNRPPTPKELEARIRQDAYARRLLVLRPRWRVSSTAYRMRHPHRAYESRRRSWQRYKDRYYERRRAYYRNHRDEILLRGRVYWRDNRERLNAQKRAYRAEHLDEYRERGRKWRAENYSWWLPQYRDKNQGRLNANNRAYWHRKYPDAPTRDALNAATHEFEKQVVILRAEGWNWREIGELTGKSDRGCALAYQRAMQRQQQEAR